MFSLQFFMFFIFFMFSHPSLRQDLAELSQSRVGGILFHVFVSVFSCFSAFSCFHLHLSDRIWLSWVRAGPPAPRHALLRDSDLRSYGTINENVGPCSSRVLSMKCGLILDEQGPSFLVVSWPCMLEGMINPMMMQCVYGATLYHSTRQHTRLFHLLLC